MALRTVECLTFQPESPYGARMFKALRQTATVAGISLQTTTRYRGGSDALLLWGPGGVNRFGPMREQLASGRHVLAWDLAYWHRDTKARVSIDAAHPQAWVMRHDWPMSRWLADDMPVSTDWNPDGPVVVAGIGPKARVQYGAGVVDGWEAAMIRACGTRRVLYRPKNGIGVIPAGATRAGTGPIDAVLRGASCLVTWHSNVAVDAIRLGIPVVCRDGAAAAVCPSEMSAHPTPLPVEVRDRFLANLAHFQWGFTPQEASGCWAFLQELLS